MIKKCKICEQEKVISFFRKGRRSCKDCESKFSLAYYKVNRSNVLLKQIEYKKIYRKEQSKRQKEVDKKYRNHNRVKLKIRKSEFYTKNKGKIQASQNEYKKNRREIDPIFKMREIVSTTIRKFLKINNGSKAGVSCLKLLSYSLAELKTHLENQFQPWMTWSNWGIYSSKTWNDNEPSTWTWQIDHIIPQSKLPYTSMEDDNFKKCWSLSNLRPIKSKENLLKGDKLIEGVL